MRVGDESPNQTGLCSAGQVGRCIETPWNYGAGWHPAGSLVAFRALMRILMDFRPIFLDVLALVLKPLKDRPLKATGWILSSPLAAKVGSVSVRIALPTLQFWLHAQGRDSGTRCF